MTSYKRHRFPPAIIQYAVWPYYRFNLSHRDIEDLLAERGIEVSHESVRLWCNMCGPLFSKRLKRRHPGFGDTFFIDEVFVAIAGRRQYLGSYGVARRALMPETIHSNDRYANNRAEQSRQSTRAWERDMRRFSPAEQAQRFLSAHAVVYSLFNLHRHLASAAFHRFRRARAFKHWNEAVAA